MKFNLTYLFLTVTLAASLNASLITAGEKDKQAASTLPHFIKKSLQRITKTHTECFKINKTFNSTAFYNLPSTATQEEINAAALTFIRRFNDQIEENTPEAEQQRTINDAYFLLTALESIHQQEGRPSYLYFTAQVAIEKEREKALKKGNL